MAPLICKQSCTSHWIMTAFELFLPDWWLVINSFILLKGVPHYHPNINPVPREVAKPSRQDFALRLHRLVKIKRVCQWHFEDGSPKTEEEKKKMNYVRSLWILHLQRMVSHMPVVSSPRQESNWNALRLAQYSRGKLSPLFSYSPLSPEALRCRLWWVF